VANEINLEILIKSCNQLGLKITSRWYRILAKEDKVPEIYQGKVDGFKALIMLALYYQKLAQGSGSLTLTDERTRLTKINADRKQLELEKARGELINTDRAMLAWGMITKNVDNKLLVIPRKSAPLLFGLTLSEIEAKQHEIINEVRNEVTNPNLRELTGMATRKNGGSNIKAKASLVHSAVGRPKQNIKSRK
jgi:hypothetical protein